MKSVQQHESFTQASVVAGRKCPKWLITLFAIGLLVILGSSRQAVAQSNNESASFCSSFSSDKPLKSALVGTTSKLWPNGTMLNVVFDSDVDQVTRNEVANAAYEWTKSANIRFAFYDVSIPPATVHIRIRFDGSRNRNSFIGKDSLEEIRAGRASMILGDINRILTDPALADQRERARGSIMHEFGHALGMEHEHQNPNAGIQWNPAPVYADFKALGWTQEMVDHNVFATLDRNSTNFSTFDPDSIMVYRIKKEWTMNEYSVERKNVLSSQDRNFIGTLYPYSTTEFTEAPALTFHPNSRHLQVIVRGKNNEIYQKYYHNGSWSNWGGLGGKMTSAPAVAYNLNNDSLHVFARGTNNAIYHNYWDTSIGGWSGWQGLGGDMTSAPAVVYDSVGRYLHVFARGTDNAIYENKCGGGCGPGEWSGWMYVGGDMSSAPAAAFTGRDGSLHVFAKGTDHKIYEKKFSYMTGWTGWMSRGGMLASAPAAAVDGQVLHLFARGTDGTIRHCFFNYDTQTWYDDKEPDGNWKALGGNYYQINSAPAAVGAESGVVHVFAQSLTPHALVHKYVNRQWYEELFY